MEKEIKPPLHNDGGDIELIDVIGNRVLVKLKGSCAGCVASNLTIKSLVEDKLKEFVSDSLTVEEANEWA